MKLCLSILFGSALGILATSPGFAEPTGPASEERDFAGDLAVVQKHLPTVVLSRGDTGAKVVVAPSLQGRVLTSTTGGDHAPSFGWINLPLLASGQKQAHINAYGGEDRVWLGPEGGQYGLYFAPGAPFDFAHWQTPAVLDTEPFDVVRQGPDAVTMSKDFDITNHAGTTYRARIERTVRVLAPPELWTDLKVAPRADVQAVAYESDNRLTNLGTTAWEKSSGLLSIWILGQFNASPQATVFVPFRQGSESELGPVVESNYFGTVPADRLKVGEGIISFRADGHYRSKLGLSPRRALSAMASYDAANGLLTIVQATPPEPDAPYVNSLWKQQEQPFAGPAVNSYNDGPNDTGDQLGSFYEMETSSPALALAPQQTAAHFQRTIHLHGSPEALRAVAREAMGADVLALAFP